VLAPKNPIVCSLPACCARATSGHAAIAPTDRRDELAPFQLHPLSPGRQSGAGYRIGEHQSGACRSAEFRSD